MKKLSSTSGPGSGLVTPATVKITTSALKDQLREKEQHIEQLLRERDMERAEVTNLPTRSLALTHSVRLCSKKLSIHAAGGEGSEPDG